MSIAILTKIFGNKSLAGIYRQDTSVDNINTLFEKREAQTGKSYAPATIASYTSTLRSRGFVDSEGYFTDKFIEIVKKEATKIKDSRHKIDKYSDEAELRNSVIIEDGMDLKDVFNILAKNTNMNFIYPPNKQISNVDFDCTTVQYVRLNNLSHYIRYPEYIKYKSVCPLCGVEYEVLEDKPPKCNEDKTTTKIRYDLSLSRACFIYMIDYQHEQYAARCLDVLPLGDFKAAVIIIKDKKAYTLFIIATAKPDKPKVTLEFNQGDRLHQLVKYIDDICGKRINKQIHGMTYYKYAIILSYTAALARMVNYNIYIAGAGGLGKTATARIYNATITEKTKCQDSTNLSQGSGLRGSTQHLSISNRVYTVHEPGLLERFNIVVLDEVLEMGGDNSDKAFLKSSLSSSTLTVEVAGNRTEIPKNATVIGTSNIPRWVKSKRAKYIEEDKNPEIEFEIEGRWHVDGQNFHFLDRFALLFYLDASEINPDFNTNDQRISDVELRQILYTPEIDNYLKVCSQIKVEIPESIKMHLVKLSTQSYDPVHSTSRRNSYISMTVQLHAMINGRNTANMDDVRFTKQLLRKCFNPITVNMLAETYQDVQQPLDIWVLKTILAKLKTSSKEKLKREASRKNNVSNFDDIFEDALHYNEIMETEKGVYRCTGIFD